jgi:hypothetical protein
MREKRHGRPKFKGDRLDLNNLNFSSGGTLHRRAGWNGIHPLDLCQSFEEGAACHLVDARWRVQAVLIDETLHDRWGSAENFQHTFLD